MRRPARFTQAEIRRALAAAQKVGPNMGVEVALDGSMRIGPIPEKPHIEITQEFDPNRRLVF